ncbi:glycosyltransferase [bacterium]|nr:MAG: glycosyltransferase [bacterium]
MSTTAQPLVSAIVSTYKAERFIKGLLDDLLLQTIGSRLEIIVIDSGSPENEGGIVQEYQKKHPNIKYVRTERETVYAAWNRAIKLASGIYITNANTDDRRKTDAYEIMSDYLDAHPEIGLVYSDVVITHEPNETFNCNSGRGIFKFDEHDREKLLNGLCYVGPMPMWRASIHNKVGFFDPDFVTSGDLEFWVRVSEFYEFKKIPQLLGLYQKRPDSVENSNEVEKSIENLVIKYKYSPSRQHYLHSWPKDKIVEHIKKIQRCSAYIAENKFSECITLADELLAIIPSDADALYLKATALYRIQKVSEAIPLFEKVIELNPLHSISLNNLAVWFWSKGEKQKAIAYMERCVESDMNNNAARINLAEMLIQTNKTEKAIAVLSESIRRNLFLKEALELLINYQKKSNPVLSTYYQDLLKHYNQLVSKPFLKK